MISVEVHELSKRFGGFTALDSASFRFEGPGAVGYLGPNGSGKSTTLKLLTRLLRPSRGTATINGIDVTWYPKDALWEVGSVIESPDPYPLQTGLEALQMVGEFRGLSGEHLRDQIQRYAEILELPPLERRTGKLSKGQRQRIVLAAALLSEPKIILLDEPTSGLDPAERVVIRNLLTRLKGDRLIFMSSHLLPEVTDICDKVVFISRGQIVLQDTVQALSTRFVNIEVDVEFFAPPPASGFGALQALAKTVQAVGPKKYRVAFDGSDATRQQILTACLAIAPVRSFGDSTLALEEAYLSLVGGDTSGRRRPDQ
jgi:ABC-2 type transport system ATP-binding protein